MRRLWLSLFVVIALIQAGCWGGSRKNRILKQPTVEEYNLPPSDSKVAEGPFYPELKRQLPTQIKAQQNQMPSMKGSGAGGGGGFGAGGPGGP